jgi:aspartate racemase
LEEIFDVSRLPESFAKRIEAHYRAMRAYVPQVFPGRVTLFRARTRPLFGLHGRDLGWAALAGQGLDIVEIPGNHESILQDPHVRVLAERLMEYLQKARSTSGRVQLVAPVA